MNSSDDHSAPAVEGESTSLKARASRERQAPQATRARERTLLRRMSICVAIVVILGPLALIGGTMELALIPALAAAAVSAVTAFQIRSLRTMQQ